VRREASILIFNLGDLILNQACCNPERLAVVFEDVRITYAELNKRVNKLGNALLALGVKPGDRVGVNLHNCNQYIEAYFACAKIGAVSAHFNYRLAPWNIAELISDAGAKVMLFSAKEEISYHALLERLPHEVRFISVGGTLEGALEFEDLIAGHADSLDALDTDEEDVVIQLYTSGTTGKPKGVMLTHKSYFMHELSNLVDTAWSQEDTFLQLLPMFHAAASGALNSIITGGTLVIVNSFDPREFCRTIEKERVTICGLVPNLVQALLNYPELDQYDISSLKKFIYGAAIMPVSTLKRAVQKLDCKFFQLFGMTETGPIICLLRPKDHVVEGERTRLLRSVGQPSLGSRIRVLDEDGNECPPGVCGEIVTRCTGLMKGYHNNPELTKKVIMDGWYHSNDIGYLDEEGYLFLVDRKEDMIISGGENIYPKEIEDCIRELTDHVIDCAVVSKPDVEWGETVCAFVIKREGSELNKSMIEEHCLSRIARFKRPREVVFVDQLPRTVTGKVKRYVLKQQLWKDYNSNNDK